MLLRRARRLRKVLCLLRDLGFGGVHTLVGWQPIPGSRLTGGRTFGTAAQVSRRLERADCKVVCVEEGTGCPRWRGRSTQFSLLAQRSL
jgi:hypothetical protein